MSVELSKKKIIATGVKAVKKPHRKSHTEFDVKRNLPKQEEQSGIRRLPRKTLKDESLALEFEEVSYRKCAPHSEKSAQLAAGNKRKPSVDLQSDKENVHPNLAREASKQKTKSKRLLAQHNPPDGNYQSLRKTVDVIRSELQLLHSQTVTMEQQNRVLYKQIHAVEQTQQLNKFLQQQTKKRMDELEKLCVRNQRTLADIQSQLHKQSQHTLSVQEKDSMSTNYREGKTKPKKAESNRKEPEKGRASCIALAESIRRKLVR